MRVAEVTDTVARCVPRHDGGWLILTMKGSHGVSPSEIPLGTRVLIKDGKAERANP